MQTINRFLYGPTAEERMRQWQGKLRQEQRVLDREMRQVRLYGTPSCIDTHLTLARYGNEQSETDCKAACLERRCQIRADSRKRGSSKQQTEGSSVGEQGEVGVNRQSTNAADGYDTRNV